MANQFNHVGGNLMSNVFGAQLPDVTTVSFWNCCDVNPTNWGQLSSCFVTYVYDTSDPCGYGSGVVWYQSDDCTPADVSNVYLNPGQGAYICPSVSVTLKFVGTANVPVLPATLPCGCGQWNLLSCQTNAIGTYQNVVGLAPVAGSQVVRWNCGIATTYTYSGTSWSPSAPSLNIGEAAFFFVPCGTNCCTNCTPPYPLNYTNIIYPGSNFIANNLCQGVSNSVNVVLSDISCPTCASANLDLSIWDSVGQKYYSQLTYYDADDSPDGGGGWYDATGNNATNTIDPGQGFLLINHDGTFTLTIHGCAPTCPPSCSPPTNQMVMVGRLGIGPATWWDLFSCPPPCGAQMLIWNGSSLVEYDFYNLLWHTTDGNPVATPVLAIGQSAFASVRSNTNCPCISMTCFTNKTVLCGSTWNFDAPTNIVDNCCSNYNVNFTTMTNSGPCPLVIMRTWTVSDSCSNSATCSQTVTVVNTNLPVILCPSNIVMSSCVATQIFYTATASNVCCGNLAAWCNPPSGTSFLPGTTNTVTCTTVDCCSNIASCTFTVTVVCSTNPCVPPPPNLVGWWPGDNSPNDLSSFANNATLQNGATYGAGEVAAAFYFPPASGNSQAAVAAPAPGSLDFGTNVSFTIDAWINTVNGGTATIVDKRGGDGSEGNTFGYVLFVYNGKLGFQLGSGEWDNYVASGPLIDDGNWHFVVVTVDRAAKQARLYVDNVLVLTANTARVEGNISNTGMFLIGQNNMNGGSSFAGAIDEVEVFNRVLGTNEIASIFNAGTAGKCKCTSVAVLACATNKTVECGSSWTFDAPTVVSNTCGTNLTEQLVSSNATFVSQCQTLWQGIWFVTDCCGNTLVCTQTVTVVDTMPPVITCASNKTVQCGTAWTFDRPSAWDACCGSNVTVWLASSNLISGPCPAVWQGIWEAMDCCSNVATCTQLVTVVKRSRRSSRRCA